MEKNIFKTAFLIFLLQFPNHLLSVQNDNFDTNILIDISEQRLYLIKNSSIIESFPISSSKFGEGSIVNSYKTPLGRHKIKDKIGDNAALNTIFISRINI